MAEVSEFRFPVRLNDLSQMTEGGWLKRIDGLKSDQILDILRTRWSTFNVPYLQDLASTILQMKPRCLSMTSEGSQWLTLDCAKYTLHIAPPARLPETLLAQFPFARIPGLTDFLENFGGLANWSLPPCPWFTALDQCRVVTEDCDLYDWGMIGNWKGSLTLYNTLGGNFIVISPDNVCGLWDHEIGWESETDDPFFNLNWTMSDLVREFIAYLSLSEDDAKESPFYY